MFPKPMALEITEETYDIAVAILPGGFAFRDKEDVLGRMLVINELQPKHYFRDKNQRPSELKIGNVWLSKKAFDKKYQFVTKPKNNQFTEIEKI